MELLDRYLLQIERYLPIQDRKDTLEELKNLLLEDLDVKIAEGKNKDEALYTLIKDYGPPKEVALKYRNDGAIISREMEPILYLILKIIVVVVPLAVLLGSTITYLSETDPINFVDLFINIFRSLPAMISSTLSGIGTVFIIFVVIERYFKEPLLDELKEFELPEFDPKKLPMIPDNVFKASLFESVFVIAGSILFLYLLNYQQGLIVVYIDGNTLPLLNDSFNNILPLIDINIIFIVIVEIIHIIKRQKTFLTSTLEYIHALISVVILSLLATSNVFNNIVFDNYDLSIIPKLFEIGMIVGAVATLIGSSYKYFKVLKTKKVM